MPRIAVFDVDHTITRASTGRRLVEYGRRAGVFTVRDLLALPFYYVRYRAGKLRIDQVAERTIHLAGWKESELNEIAQACYRERVRGDIMPGAAQLIHHHREQGDLVAIATSSLRLVIEPLAAELEIEHVVCTELEFADGVATGGFTKPPCFGDEKRRRVAELVTRLGASLEDVTFYSDSRLDLPLLEAVGTPVVVNPDAGLRRAARTHGWRVLFLR
jgi:HAD superfamily hydrolase (TIGR01490 family)